MAHDLEIDQNKPGGVSIKIDGYDVANKAQAATLEFRPATIPTLTLTMPFMRCAFKGKANIAFEDPSLDNPIMDALREENKDLKEMIDRLNEKIAILMDT